MMALVGGLIVVKTMTRFINRIFGFCGTWNEPLPPRQKRGTCLRDYPAERLMPASIVSTVFSQVYRCKQMLLALKGNQSTLEAAPTKPSVQNSPQKRNLGD